MKLFNFIYDEKDWIKIKTILQLIIWLLNKRHIKFRLDNADTSIINVKGKAKPVSIKKLIFQKMHK